MNSYFHLPTFLDDLASGEPTPGGGSAAALAGALGAALATMVANLTVGRKRYVEHDAQMQAVVQAGEALRSYLVDLVAEDAAAYEQVRAAYRLPRDTEQDNAVRHAAIQAAMQAASLTPLDTMRACVEALKLAEQVVAVGNVNASTDGAVGALLAHAGLQGAALNVRVNLSGIEDAGFVASAAQTVAELQAEAQTLLARTLSTAEARLG